MRRIEEKVEETFLKELKESIEASNRKSQYKPSQTYKPSSLKCIRNMYYQVMGTEPDPSDKNYTLIGINQSGTDIHIRIQQAVEDMINNGFDCEYIDVADYIKENNIPDIEIKGKSGMETKLYSPKYNISFMCDGIIKYKNVYYIIEFKTETSRKFAARYDIDPDHYNQATAYSLLLKLPNVLFVYICRDNLDLKSYMMNVNQIMLDKLELKLNMCDEYVKEKIVPPKPTINSYICQYCDYKSTCEKDK